MSFSFLFLIIYFFLVIYMTFLVIGSRNIVLSILSLVFVYLSIAFFFLWLGVEFLAILIFIIYVGAISVLFLFVVMLLNLRSLELFNIFFNFLPIGSFIGIFFCLELFFLFFSNFNVQESSFFFFNLYNVPFFSWSIFCFFKSNLSIFGYILYNHYWFFVLLISLILLVSMFGSIILVLDSFFNTKFFIYDFDFYTVGIVIKNFFYLCYCIFLFNNFDFIVKKAFGYFAFYYYCITINLKLFFNKSFFWCFYV